MPKDAFAVRRITDTGAGLHYPRGSVIEGMPDDQFAAWSAAGMVREATDGELGRKTPPAEPAAPMGARAIAAPPPSSAPKGRRRGKRACAGIPACAVKTKNDEICPQGK